MKKAFFFLTMALVMATMFAMPVAAASPPCEVVLESFMFPSINLVTVKPAVIGIASVIARPAYATVRYVELAKLKETMLAGLMCGGVTDDAIAVDIYLGPSIRRFEVRKLTWV